MGACQSNGTKTREADPYCPDGSPRQAALCRMSAHTPYDSPRTQEQQTGAVHYLHSFLPGVNSVFSGAFTFDTNEEKHAVLVSFMNSCVEITRTKFRLRMEAVVDIIKKISRDKKLEALQAGISDVSECYVDAGFSRLLNAWMANGVGSPDKQSGSSCQSGPEGKVGKANVPSLEDFASKLTNHLRSATVVPAMNLFQRFAPNACVMSVEQFGAFLCRVQGNDATHTHVMEKCKYRFGGIIHKYNFNTYLMGLSTNNALDPSRTTAVWQDMTQPLTHYLIKAINIESDDDLKRALSDNYRAYILNIRKEGSVLSSGSCPITNILDAIKVSGFVQSPYPIILCLSPLNSLALEVKDELARMFESELGPKLAKGLMFEGAVISDPKFSPAAQRKRVLLLGYQSRLKPFVGSLMADMNRDGLGVRVTDVLAGTPAAKAGVSKDDWFTHINGHAILNKQHLREHLVKLNLGDELTLKRENQDEVKIVVGGAVDTDDKSESTALSNILFLKYTECKCPKPWETRVLTAGMLQHCKLTKKDLEDHFALFVGEKGNGDSSYINAATRMGIQLIDNGGSHEGRMWAQGRFVDNGRSGYLLKTNTEGKATVSITLEILAGPQEINGPPLVSSAVRVYGGGSANVEGNKIHFKDCDETTVVVIDCRFGRDNNIFCFTSAFPPLLLRAGYRVLRLEQTGGPLDLGDSSIGAYCLVHWNELA
ncbi:PDZ domain [Trypanosoma vivax]|uniref:PDZ domain-containing protein n=1 Tax=Trypanosoma vivax (strain Y486) TaxID=1055687 RepID=G0TWM9_TRYVY|nr:hypothetical protein TRVL_09474 [Trypanosoma vivax]KAH8609083.1 PDZ domain [Trypanosoma vivax]CCC48367.1 conserved hypothetical protein [Trypanosoma vivax Y486]